LLTICPSCLSLQGGNLCSKCGNDLQDTNKKPMFYLKIGWSRSRDFETILEMMQKEEGYKYYEIGEEVSHAIPIHNLNESGKILDKYEKALNWKETVLQTPEGKILDPEDPVVSCFIKMIREGTAPCKDEQRCPYTNIPLLKLVEHPELLQDYIFMKTIQARKTNTHGENHYVDSAGNKHEAPLDQEEEMKLEEEKQASIKTLVRLFLSDLLNQPELFPCPFFRTMISLLTQNALPKLADYWPFLVEDVEKALETGSLIIGRDGNYLPMKEVTPDIIYEFFETTHIPAEAKWGAASQDLQFANIDDRIYIVPEKQKIAEWPEISSIKETTDDRLVLIPPTKLRDAVNFIVINKKQDAMFKIGPFPHPWNVDSRLKNFAFLEEDFDGQKIYTGQFVWNSFTPSMMVDTEVEIDGLVSQIKIEENSLAAILDKHELFVKMGRNKERYSLHHINTFHFLNKYLIVVLWGNGRKISFISRNGERKDYYLLLKAKQIQSTIEGNVILVFSHRIMEMSPQGEILDYKHDYNNQYHATAQGYLRKEKEKTWWHYLDRTKIRDILPEQKFEDIQINYLPKSLSRINVKNTELMAELLILLNNYCEEEEYLSKIEQLWEEAPEPVKKQLDEMASSFDWLQDFRNKKGSWPVKSEYLEEKHYDNQSDDSFWYNS
jgi:hypothetical protein